MIQQYTHRELNADGRMNTGGPAPDRALAEQKKNNPD
jgi:hypothetical protein